MANLEHILELNNKYKNSYGQLEKILLEVLEKGEVTQTDLDAGEIVNVAYASSGGIGSNTDTVTVTAVQTPGLRMVKSADKSTYNEVGEVITYTYTVENTGNVTLDGPFTILDDPLGVITNSIGSLAPGATGSETTTYAVIQLDLDRGEIVNVASASFGGIESNTDTVTITAVKGPELKLTKTADKTTYGAVGEVITYTYLLENAGNVTLEGPFSIEDNLLGIITNSIGSLAPNATGSATTTYAVTQADLDAGSIVNIAFASCIHSPGDSNGEEATSIQMTQPCDVISNTSSAIVEANYTVTYLPGTYGNFGTETHSELTYGALTPTPPSATTDQANVVFVVWSPAVATTVSATVVYTAQWRTTGGGGGGGGGTVIVPEEEVPAA